MLLRRQIARIRASHPRPDPLPEQRSLMPKIPMEVDEICHKSDWGPVLEDFIVIGRGEGRGYYGCVEVLVVDGILLASW